MKRILVLLILHNMFFLIIDDSLVYSQKTENNYSPSLTVYEIVLPELKIGVDFIFKEEFKEAENIYTSIISKYPGNAIGYFAMGSLFSIQKDIYETQYFDDLISKYFNRTTTIIVNYLEKEDYKINELNYEQQISQKSIYYYLWGYIKLNASYEEVKNKNYLSAFFKALDGIDDIEESIEISPNFKEPNFLLGSYIFFKNKLHSMIYDSRQVGIDLVKSVVNETFNINRFFAISVLANIYIDKEDYNEASESISYALDIYPNSRVFLFIDAKILFKQKKYPESIKIYSKIEEIILEKNPTNFKRGFNLMYCTYRKIILYDLLDDNVKVKELLNIYDNMKSNFLLNTISLKERIDNISSEIEEIREKMLEINK